ncbi:MAG: hypothetical protein GXY61_06885 [Lentisphaerae bacterium]|nr:hypothetical protein [Lentisphaerota bacterium]
MLETIAVNDDRSRLANRVSYGYALFQMTNWCGCMADYHYQGLVETAEEAEKWVYCEDQQVRILSSRRMAGESFVPAQTPMGMDYQLAPAGSFSALAETCAHDSFDLS